MNVRFCWCYAPSFPPPLRAALAGPGAWGIGLHYAHESLRLRSNTAVIFVDHWFPSQNLSRGMDQFVFQRMPYLNVFQVSPHAAPAALTALHPLWQPPATACVTASEAPFPCNTSVWPEQGAARAETGGSRLRLMRNPRSIRFRHPLGAVLSRASNWGGGGLRT